MRKLILILGVLLVSVIGALWFREQSGYVLLHVNGLSMQASLLIGIGALVAVIIASYLLLRLTFGALHAPGGVRRWWRARRLDRARVRMLRALKKLAEGDFSTAERDMIRTVPHSDMPLLHYLSAAWAAHRAGAENRRDHYLALADQAAPDARLAVGLVQAQLYVEDGQWETAFATLNLLQDRWPSQPRVLELLAMVCERLEEWDRLLDLLPLLRRHTVMDARRVDELERRAAVGHLEQSCRQGSDALTRAWARLSRSATRQEAAQLAYIDGRLSFDAGDAEAEKLLRNGLRKRWENQWVQRYGRLRMARPEVPLATAEAWLREHPEDAELLLAVGRLAMVAGQWDRARTCLEAAVARSGAPEACYLLARMLEELGESDKANRLYRQAMEQDPRFLPPPGVEGIAPQRPEGKSPLRVVQG